MYTADTTGQPAAADTMPSLQEGPVLHTGPRRKLNHKGLLFIGGIGAIGAAMAAWGASQLGAASPARAPSAKVSEVVQLPPEQYRISQTPAASEPEPAALPPLPPLPETAIPAPPVPAVPLVPNAPVATNSTSAAQERSMLAQQRGSGSPVAGNETPAAAPIVNVARGSVTRLASTTRLLVRGTQIRCVLETRIVSALPGFASCIVTEPVYSVRGDRLLIPAGSRISGQYNTDSAESGRVAIIWERVLAPDGLDVHLSSPGTDGLGGAGHPGHVDRHWSSRVGAAVLVSLLGDAVQIAAAQHAPRQASNRTTSISVDTGAVTEQTNPYQSQTAKTLQSAANGVLREAANRPATITLQQGTLVHIHVSRDIDFGEVLPP